MLTAYVDFHRATLASKCRGLSPEQMSAQTMTPSTRTLHGLLRQLTAGERWWFQINFAGDDVPMLSYTDDDPDRDVEEPRRRPRRGVGRLAAGARPAPEAWPRWAGDG